MNAGFVASAFGLGATLAILPGPVQFVLLTESTRGGGRRGFLAMVGANGTLGVELIALAAGLSFLVPGPGVVRVMKIVGGGFLLFLASDAIRSALRSTEGDGGVGAGRSPGRTPLLRGVFAVLLNAPAWLFLATTASALFATAVSRGGRPLSLLSAVAMTLGVSAIDGSMVLLGGGVRRFELRVARWLTPLLAIGLAAFDVVLVVQGVGG
jgi:threonine/homoserine/homoserine lactone efflux protein